MEQKKEHLVIINATEMVKKVGKSAEMHGFESSVRYVGENKDGIDKGLAASIIIDVAKSQNLPEEKLKKFAQYVTDFFMGDSAEVVTDVKDFEETAAKVEQEIGDYEGETAKELFERWLKDDQWGRVMKGKTDFNVKDNGKKVLVWVATALNAIECAEKGKKGRYKRLERLFLKEVAGIDSDDK